MNTTQPKVDVAKIAKEVHDYEAAGATDSEMANAYEFVRANAEAGGYEDELELALQRMTFSKALSSYRGLLDSKPGHALKIGEDSAALIVDGRLCAAHIHAQPVGFKLGNAFEFDESGWDSDNECWDNDITAIATTKYIKNPEYLPLT